MSIKTKLIQLFCDHNEQECLSTITPHYMDNLYRGNNKNVFVFKCVRCGKFMYKTIEEPKYNPFYYDYIVKVNKLHKLDNTKENEDNDEIDMDEGYSII